jgi:hypothetical protein
MNSKLFSYKVSGIELGEEINDLKVSSTFDRKAVLEQLKELFKEDNYKIDERTLDYKVIDGQLYIEGLAVENEAPKTVGFTFGK